MISYLRELRFKMGADTRTDLIIRMLGVGLLCLDDIPIDFFRMIRDREDD